MLRSLSQTLLCLAAAAVIGASSAAAQETVVPATPQDTGYRINGGDLLHISVYGEPNLDKDVPVQPDGGIAFPLVGNLNARGKTLQELQQQIATNLRESQYFPNLTDNEVTVSMVKATGNSVSVVGQVKAPGTFAYDTRLDVMQALSLAGGLTPFASKSKIKILRRDDTGTQTAILFDYSEVEDGENLDKNILLRGGDVVVVPQAGLF
ncbi:polysaccharide biosynthesis/export family protein [Dongia deserti]|uniref:polysaccharide biosynthesis/export family protein n=1 Tax=Dongia deserti TaxID=2268030 RepID=UPI0013C4328C|nr:polysaccharide biosynthesis/export family protein [Dongia deserti]